ncbi:RluA family pseudouridine synthase [Thermosipho atlanticus]|uniref:Pseudouridine synthase n=1 Tax=Thermosipho atlanticus DSM 15807 TaxID=1123380 RepID=A0A1M5TI92_9BACT|nr:RluA family pseudouridine synthase [Thermosipho atlanticus]SHH50477.1 ribosomal large subunit pseudouridine synthase C [Thermosipho atlanticus DSM 15807]
MIVNEKNYYSRLDKFLRKNFPNLPLSVIYKFIRTGKILVNGKKVKNPSFEIEIGDEIKINESLEKYSREVKNTIKPIKMKLDIIYENEDLLVINKPSGIPLHPGKGIHVATLIEGLLYYGQQKGFKPHLVHRLDKHTSGILVVAKNTKAARILGEIISSRSVEKEYVTLVKGKLNKAGKIDLPIEGKDSLTLFTTKEIFKTEIGFFSLLHVIIKTGRKHQIRRHFSNIGHPVIGDDVYGDRKLNREFRRNFGLKRYFLHCKRMSFYYEGKKIDVQAKLTEDLEFVIKKVKEGV